MEKEFFKFKFFDMPVAVRQSAVYGSLIIMIVLTIAAIAFTNLTILDAIITGIIGMLLHWLGDLVHQYGHFFAAKQLKYPSTGIVLWWVLSTTLYPKNEDVPSPLIHMRRAIGGPIAGFILAVVFTIISVLWLLNYSEFSRFIAIWGLLDYWGVFTIGALFPPLKIGPLATDGWIIWKNLQKQSSKDITTR